MKNKIYKILQKFAIFIIRKERLKNANKIGKCTINENEILCIVDGDKLKKKSNEHFEYDLSLNGIIYRDIDKKMLEICGLNKPVKYIIENVEFDRKIRINSYFNADIIFKNCIFNGSILLDVVSGSVTFEDNKYLANYNYGINYDKHTDFYISTRSMNGDSTVNSIRFKDDYLFVDKNIIYSGNPVLKLYLSADKTQFINTVMANKDGELNIKTSELVLDKSTLYVKDAFIEADNIKYNKGFISAKDNVVIDNINTNEDFKGHVYADEVLYNGELIKRNHKKDEENDLITKRNNLLNLLKKIKNNCDIYIYGEITRISGDINNQNVTKILKKEN